MTFAPYPPNYTWLVMAKLDDDWHCVYPTHLWEEAHKRYLKWLQKEPAVPVRMVCEMKMSTFSTVPMCLNCHQQIENRAEPSMTGPREPRWMHIPGGYSICFPQRKDSPTATPTPESVTA